jgi:hypothetical protein
MQPYDFFISRQAEKITISKSPLEASNIISMVYRIMNKKSSKGHKYPQLIDKFD